MNQPIKMFSLLIIFTLGCVSSGYAAKSSDQDTSQLKKPFISAGAGGSQLVLPNTNQPKVDGVAKPEVLEARVTSPTAAPPQLDRLYVCRDIVYKGAVVTAPMDGPMFGECPEGYRCTDPRTGKCEWQYDSSGIVYGTPRTLTGNYTCPQVGEARDCSPGFSFLSGGQ